MGLTRGTNEGHTIVKDTDDVITLRSRDFKKTLSNLDRRVGRRQYRSD